MARGPQRPRGMSDYDWRIYRQTGLTSAQANARGISLAAVRGHRPKRLTPEGPILREHQIRDIRRQQRGEPTEAERRFLHRQAKRSGRDYGQLRSTFMGYSQHKRNKIREIQHYARRRYTATRGRFRWDTDRPRGAPAYYGGSGDEEEDTEPARGGGFYGDKTDEIEANYDFEPDDWDAFPDLGDVDDAFMFYH